MMEGDFRLEKLLASRDQPFVRALLVALHERGIAYDVGGENGGKLAFHGFSPTVTYAGVSSTMLVKEFYWRTREKSIAQPPAPA
jgi:hypothetical protein